MSKIAQKKICRFCFEPDDQKLVDIFSEECGKLALQVMSCVSIEIFEGDEMPRYCCDICRKLMEFMHQYKQICRKSDIMLKQSQITGTLADTKFELPLTLLRECLPDNRPEMLEKETNTENKAVSKGIQTEEIFKRPAEVPTPVKKRQLNAPKVQKPVTIVVKNVEIAQPQPKKRRIEPQEEEIEILELTQSEVDNLHPKVTSTPLLLNKSFEQSKELSKPVIEFKKFVMNDNGNFQVEILEEIQETTSGNAVFPCDFCSKTYMIKQQLELHLDTHFKERNFVCEICQNKYLSKNDLVKHFKTHTEERQHVCVVCDRSFARGGILKKHLLQHTEHLKFNCDACAEKFVTKDDLQKHTDYYHNKPRPFPCKLCDKAFAFKQGLDRHMISHDPFQNSHICDICNESFPTASKLKQHLPKHAGKRRYPCKYCPKTFILSHHLSRHVRSSHKGQKDNKNTTKTYTCTECKEIFHDREVYIAHSAEHISENHVCPLCKLKFESMEDVDQHIEEHALASEHFSCKACSCAYLTEDLLEQHCAEKHSKEVKSEEQIEVSTAKVKKIAEIPTFFGKIPKGLTIKKKI